MLANPDGADGRARVSVDVRNARDRAGDEVAQLYIRDRLSSVVRPERELRGFERISLAPGETKRVAFELGPRQLRLLDARMKWVVEPGEFEIMVGGSQAPAVKGKLMVKE